MRDDIMKVLEEDFFGDDGDFRSGTDAERAGEGDVPPGTEPEPGVFGSVVERPSPPGMYSGL